MSLSPEAIRLQRTNWSDKTNLLADEMYLILLGDRDPNVTPLQISIVSPGFPDLSFSPAEYNPAEDPDPVDFPMLYWPEFDDSPVSTNPGGSNGTFITKQRVKKQWIRNMIPGKVTGGEEGAYEVDLYPNGSSDEAVPITDGKVLGGGTVGKGAWVTVFRATHLEITEDVRVPQNPAQPKTSNGLPQYDGSSTSRMAPSQGGDKAAEQVVSVRQRILIRTHDILLPNGSGSMIPAKITSGGPGKGPYKVTLYKQGPDNEGEEAEALQLQINSQKSIPEGTWCFVTEISGTFWMQVPIWLK